MRRVSLLAAMAVVPALAAMAAEPGPTANARLDAWRVIGPGGGGTMRRPAISPHDPRVVLLGCDMTGAYLTLDGGGSWRMINFGSVPSVFAFDPSSPRTIYAGAAAVYRSDDAGRSWRMLLPDPARNTVARALGDHGDRVLVSDDPAYPGSGRSVAVHAIAVDESDSLRVYAALSASDSPVPGSPPWPTIVVGSTDGGRSWSRLAALEPGRVFALRADGGAQAPRVQAVAEDGVHEGRGETWRVFPAPGGARFTSGAFGRDPRSGVVFVYATQALVSSSSGVVGGVQASDDGGRTWRSASGGLIAAVRDVSRGEEWGPARRSRPSLGPVAVSARSPLTAYVGLRGLPLPGRGDAPFNGIATTTDGGRTWSVVHAEADAPSANLAGSWIETRAALDGHSVWFDAPYDLAVAPGDPAVAYATDLFRTYRTTDAGATWAQVNSERRGEDRWTTRGLDVTTAYGVQFDPHDARRVFIPYTDIGLFRSEDGGETWTGSTDGIPREWRNTTYWLAFDPEVKDLVWGAFSGTHDLPRPKMWRRTDPARFQGGVAVSTDGGRHWTPSNQGMAEAAVTHVILDPRSPRGSRTLYAAAFGRGVYKSTDGGRSWALRNAGVAPDPRNQPFAWRLTLAADGTLYLVVARRSERGRSGDRDDGALYRSTDGAEHWQAVPLPGGTNGPNGLTVDPGDPRRLYLSAWGVARQEGDTGGGIFLSTNAGATWRPVLAEAQHVYDVTVDARDPRLLYASGFDQAAYRSGDRGETWTRIRGFNFKWGHRVVPDPADATRIYVTTFGGSVWHGPASGDPKATEDVVTPGDASPQPPGASILGTPVLEPLPEGPRITPYLTYQLEKAWTQDARRLERFARVGSEADLAALQAELRAKALRIMGGLPETRSPLNARLTGTIAMDGYRIEKLVFESLPGIHVTALLYVPDAPGRKPAVLLACGHSPVGKAHPGYQEIAARLARRGYVVLCWDPVGQGERSQFWDRARGRSRYNLVCGEHAVLGNLATIAGTSLVRYMVWDGMRAADYLLSRDDVDGARLAITGTSGGGFQALWIGALDGRIAAVLPSCFPTALPMRMANRIFEDPDSDPEQDPPGLVSEGVDHPGLLLLAYPRPLHVAAAVLDFFPIEGTRRALREVAGFYRRFGHADRVALSEGYHKHQYSVENQTRAFAFLDRVFGRAPAARLAAPKVLPAEELWCTRSGQVREELGGRSLPEAIRDEARARPAPRHQLAALYRGDGYPGIDRWPVAPFDGAAPRDAIAWEAAGSDRVGDTVVDRYRLHHSGGLVIPLVHVRRASGPRGDVLLRAGLEGRAGPADWPDVERRLAEGRELVSFDPRALGETRLRYRAASVDDPAIAPADADAAYASPLSGVLANHVYNAQLLGRPYLLELIEDVEIVARFARTRLAARSLAVDSPGDGRLLARAAASALPDVALVPARGRAPEFSWRESVERLSEAWPIHYLFPGGASLHLGPAEE